MHDILTYPGPCTAAGFNGCCTSGNCLVSSPTQEFCYCDADCYEFGNCCDDITDIECFPGNKFFFSVLNNIDIKKQYIIMSITYEMKAKKTSSCPV